MHVDPHDLLTAIRGHAGGLHVPAGVDAVRLLWALSGNESSFGANTSPRHEPGYCHGGRYFQFTLTHDWGCLAHCSFGAFQVMAANALAVGFTPLELLTDVDKMVQCAIAHINKEIFGREGAQTLEAFADAYNSGDWRDRNVPEKYIADFKLHYATSLG